MEQSVLDDGVTVLLAAGGTARTLTDRTSIDRIWRHKVPWQIIAVGWTVSSSLQLDYFILVY